MGRRLTTGLAGLGLALALMSATWAGAAAADSHASISVSAPSASPGAQVFVVGQGFPAHSVVRLAICGNAATRGSVDCDQESSSTLAPSDQGDFRVPIPVVAPPTSCPCVVQATSTALDAPIAVPLVVTGVPVGPIQQVVVSETPLKVVSAELTGWGPLTAWFGAGPQRMLVLTLRNPTSQPMDLPAFTLTRGRHAPDTIVRSVELGTLAAGETRTYRIPVRFDVVAVGDLSVGGEVGVAGQSATFTAASRAVPWGLVVLAIVGVQLALLGLRDRARRRLVVPRRVPLLARPRRVSAFDVADPMDYWDFPSPPIS
ncbi:MAG: hypothetical protein JO054_17780 [Actinobacteria bacterium]|nr:hypothetical protein [Actinomycetota bacterium]MBV9256089.1 hypothetical protein [Actinomycetota bacterium]